jgi:hypothetical protein
VRFAFAGGVDNHDATLALDTPVIGTHWLTAGEIRIQQARLRSPLVLRCIDDFLAGRRHALSAISEVVEAVAPLRA